MSTDQKTKPNIALRRFLLRALIAIGLCVALLGTCMGPHWVKQYERTQQREKAVTMWQERCKKSGEFIHKTVDGVEGVYLVNMRTRTNMGEQPEDQFELDDPYGRDLTGDGYLASFLRDSYAYARPSPLPRGWPRHTGYRFVEAHDPKDGKLYRYTGRVLDKPNSEFIIERMPIANRSARYGVKFEDISTRDEREYWIAGSSLKVIDLENQAILGERIGYMVDLGQGSRGGGRSPWLFAADYACPDFDRDYPNFKKDPAHKSRSQPRQTQRFVEKIIKPIE